MDMNTKGDGTESDQDLASNELPDQAPNEEASCPILHDVTLLPLRYGRVEVEPEGYDPGVPYKLQSRPLGYRLLRDGYIYIYNENEGKLHEYPYIDDCVIGGPIKYRNYHVIYASFSEIEWSDRKKDQIINGHKDRSLYMQRVNLSAASTCRSSANLLTIDDAKKWVAEFSEEYHPEKIEDGFKEETEPYIKEKDSPRFLKTRLGKLSSKQNIPSLDECLCLVLRDDVGVMLDLAEHQDEVVGWLEKWATAVDSDGDDNQKKFVIGSVIESLSEIDLMGFETLLSESGDKNIKEIFEDWKELPPEDQEEFQRELVNLLNHQEKGQYPEFRDEDLPKEAIQFLKDNFKSVDHYRPGQVLAEDRQRCLDEWYTLSFLEASDAQFVERHMDTIVDLQNIRRKQLEDLLNAGINSSRGFGSDGINDLVVRDGEDGLDQYMEIQRQKIKRWNRLLDSITYDRIEMLIACRYHNASWYYDQWDDQQAELLTICSYQSLRDICRSDYATERVLTWMKQNPQYSHPFFHTLTLEEQDPSVDPLKTYLDIAQKGYEVITHSKKLANQLNRAEANRLRDIEEISSEIRSNISAIDDVWAPAISMNLSRELAELYQSVGKSEMPSLKHAFRDLDFFFKGQMLRAVKEGKVEFVVSTPEEFEQFKLNFERLIELSEETSRLSAEHKKYSGKEYGGHESARAQEKLAEFWEVRDEHRSVARKVIAALSPVSEESGGLRLAIAKIGHAGVFVRSSEATDANLARALQEARGGNLSYVKAWQFGDQLGAAIFLAQLVNLMLSGKELLGRKDVLDEDSENDINIFNEISTSVSSGFMLAQGIKDAAIKSRIDELSKDINNSGVKQLGVKLGKMHTFLGSTAYIFGVYASMAHFSDSVESLSNDLKTGNPGQRLGATLRLAGSGGMVGVNSVGTTLSVYRGMAVAFSSERAPAWALSGRTLSKLFFRLNMFGLVFSVLELAGTWVYNRYNLSALDKWLVSTPWSSRADEKLSLTLEEFELRLADIGDNPYIESAHGPTDRHYFNMVFPSIGASGIKDPLAGQCSHMVSVSPWRFRPGRIGKNMIWRRSNNEFVRDLKIEDNGRELKLAFSAPVGQDYMFEGLRYWMFALFVKVSTRHENGVYYDQEFLFRLTSANDRHFVASEGIDDHMIPGFDRAKLNWYRLTDPISAMEIFYG